MKCCKMEIVCEEKRNDPAMYLDHIFFGCASEGDWALCALPPTAFMLRMVCHSTSGKLLHSLVFVSEYLFGYGAWLRFSLARGLFFSHSTPSVVHVVESLSTSSHRRMRAFWLRWWQTGRLAFARNKVINFIFVYMTFYQIKMLHTIYDKQ